MKMVGSANLEKHQQARERGGANAGALGLVWADEQSAVRNQDAWRNR